MLLTAALMAEHNGFVGALYSPKIALVYSFDSHQSMRLSASRAYRTPSCIEEKADFRLPTTQPPFSLGQLGNRSLDPERIVAYELGYRGEFFARRLRLNLELFYHRIKDLIIYQQTAPGLYQYRNAANNHVRGMETTIGLTPRRWWRLTGSYTYQRGSDDFLRGLVIGHKFTLGNRLFLPWGMVLNAHLSYVDDMHYEAEPGIPETTVPPYTRLDLRLSKMLWSDRIELALVGPNLFEAHHYESAPGIGVGQAGRTVFVGLDCWWNL